MKNLVVSLALGLALGGCQVGSDSVTDTGSGPEDVIVHADGYFTLARDARRCASPMCGGYYVTPVNASSARCVDGTTAARCYVASLDLAALGLPAAQRDEVSSGRGSILLRGRVAATTANRYGQFVAAEAWRSATGAAPTQSVSRVSTAGTECAFIPCSTLAMQRVNSGAQPLPVVGVDVSALTLDAATRDDVLGAATRDDGVLIAGVRSTMPGNPSTERVPFLRASQAFLRVTAPTAAGQCGAQLQATLAHATERLLYTSETDAPFTWFAPAGQRAVPADAAFLALLGLPADTHIERVTLDRMLGGAEQNNDGGSLQDEHRAARFRQLVRAIDAQLTGVTVIRVGTISIRVFIVGVTRCGAVAGLETLAVET